MVETPGETLATPPSDDALAAGAGVHADADADARPRGSNARRALSERLRRFLRSTPRRSFALYPLLVVADAARREGRLTVARPGFLPLLAWGYLQYRLTREYRQRLRAGSLGMATAPRRLIQSGPYAYTRNPMYLGHLIFLLGLALSFRSRLGWLILLANIPWFHARVRRDEARLRDRFGAEYEAYCARVRRWLPGLV